MSIPLFSIKRPVTVIMFYLGVTVVGVLSVTRLAVELMPNTSFGNITIFIGVRGGLPPPEIESLITKKVEESVSGVSNLKNIISSSKMNKSVVTIEFEPGTDMDFASLEVRENFNKIKDELPDHLIEKPVIAKYEENDLPIMILGMTSDQHSPEFMRELVEGGLKEQLLRVPGVANVEIGGGRERKILVEVEQSRMQAYAVPMNKIINTISAANVNLLVGAMTDSRVETGIKTPGAFKAVEEIKLLPVRADENFGILRLNHIAEVKDSYMEAQSYSRLSLEGKSTKDAVSVYIQKESMANTIFVSDRLEKVIAEFNEDLSLKYPAIKLYVVSKQSALIKNAVKTVLSALVLGTILAVAVLYLFLKKLRYTFVVAVVIPISVMLTFIAMYLTKISINIISLSGLALGIGMLLDNSIVVLENVFKRKENIAESEYDGNFITAASEEMILAITASTLTTIIVFVPITFINKQVRMLYSDLSLTVTYSLLASLIIALSAVPLFVNWLRQKEQSSARNPAAEKKPFLREPKFAALGSKIKNAAAPAKIFLVRTADILMGYLRRFYFAAVSRGLKLAGGALTDRKIKARVEYFFKHKMSAGRRYNILLGFFLRHRYWLLAGVSVLFAAALLTYRYGIEKEFIGSTEQNEFTIFVELPSGTKLDITNSVVGEVEKRITEIPEIANTLKTTQSRVEGWSSKIYITLLPKKDRVRSTEQIIADLRGKLKNIGNEYDAFVYFSEPRTSREFVVDVFGYDYDKLANLANTIAQEMEQFTREGKGGGFVDIKLRYRPGRPSFDFNIDKTKAAFFNLTTKDIADSLHAQLRGMRASFFRSGGKEVEIVPRLAEKHRSTLYDVKNHLTVINDRGHNVFVKDIVSGDDPYGLVPSEIWRKNKNRMIQVSATLDNISLMKAADAVNGIISRTELPKHYYCEIGGEYDQMIRNEREFKFAIILSLILVYAVLAALFESYADPLIIMVTVPMALIGVVFAIYFSVRVVSVGVFIGMLMLGGIVVNNAIILIDRINARSAMKGNASTFILIKILMESGLRRMRPILMTTLSTVFGLVPMALDRSESSNLWSPLAIAVIGGLVTSTFLTLIMIPSVYFIFREAKNYFLNAASKWLGKIFKKTS